MNPPTNNLVDRNGRPRVVITGMGAITPVGNTIPEIWDSFKNGRSGISWNALLDVPPGSCNAYGDVTGFDPGKFIHRKKLRHMAFASQLAVVSAGQAIQDAGLDLEEVDRDQIGVILGTGGGHSVEETERTVEKHLDGSSRRLSPFHIMRIWPNMPAYFVAEAYRLRGYNSTVVAACAAGNMAISEGAYAIQRGDTDMMIAGGTESVVSMTALAGFVAMGALSTSFNDEPKRASRPFDADRDGFVPSRGSAVLVLERLDRALGRGARIYAEVLGAGMSNDAFHMIAPDPEGEGAALAMQRALDSAGVGIDEVDYINAHAASTPLGDRAETKAIKAVFGERAYQIPVSSTKSMSGHLMGATGALEAIACVMSIQEIVPTINYETPDPECDLDYVPNQAREAPVAIALNNSFGLGGLNCCLLLGQFKAE